MTRPTGDCTCGVLARHHNVGGVDRMDNHNVGCPRRMALDPRNQSKPPASEHSGHPSYCPACNAAPAPPEQPCLECGDSLLRIGAQRNCRTSHGDLPRVEQTTPPEQSARGDGVRTFTHADYIRDPSPATQAALDGFRVVVLDSAGKPSLTFCGQPGEDERSIEGVVVWEHNDPYPCVKVSDDPETGWVELDSLLRGLLKRRVRVTVTVLDDAPGKDGAK